MRINRSWRHLLLLNVLVLPFIVHAAPFIPDNDNTLVEELPLDPADTNGMELRKLRAILTRTPDDLMLAETVAQRYIEQSRRDSDPRYLGYAQAALAPWWDQPQPPVAVLVLRAIVRQANHEFVPALTDLNAALQRDPGNAQALLTRASIEQARGDYPAARKTCMKLTPLTDKIVGYTCLAAVLSLNGQAARSYALLKQFMIQAPPQIDMEHQWIDGLLAEMAERCGMTEAAQKHYQATMATGTPNSYLLASYADFLLDTDQSSLVVSLLRDRTRADPLLLRLTIAESNLKLASAPAHIAALRARFDASRLRGDVLHRREQARFELALQNNPDIALKLAEENWSVQREPADVRIFLEAALANNSPQRALPVLAWLDKTHLEDVRLAALINDFKRMNHAL